MRISLVSGAALALTVLLGGTACALAPPVAPVGPSAGGIASQAAATPAAPVVGHAQFPADVLDLRNWYLTLPTGRPRVPDTVEQPELATYSSTYFRLDATRDGVVFTADAGGVTTSGSDYPRSELREMNGDHHASWSNTSGTHTLRVRQAVTELPPVKSQVVTAQIHDAQSDVMEVRLQGTRLIAQYDNGRSAATLDPAYRLGTVYDLRIVAAVGRVAVFYNGVQKADVAASGSGWYFKSGSYVQTNTGKGDQPGAVARVVLYQLQVTHVN